MIDPEWGFNYLTNGHPGIQAGEWIMMNKLYSRLLSSSGTSSR